MKLLPKNFQLYHIKGKEYSLEYYGSLGWEPTVKEVNIVNDLLYTVFIHNCMNDHFRIVRISNDTIPNKIIVRQGDIAISMKVIGRVPKQELFKKYNIYERD